MAPEDAVQILVGMLGLLIASISAYYGWQAVKKRFRRVQEQQQTPLLPIHNRDSNEHVSGATPQVASQAQASTISLPHPRTSPSLVPPTRLASISMTDRVCDWRFENATN
ncbi:hypothetical protein Q7P37_011122 [Cladosporium fusiforme]